jgi:hypothetical protein
MKKIILAIGISVLVSCQELYQPKYRVGDTVCAYGTEARIVRHDFINVNLTCRYMDKHGVIQTINISRGEIEVCK